MLEGFNSCFRGLMLKGLNKHIKAKSRGFRKLLFYIMLGTVLYKCFNQSELSAIVVVSSWYSMSCTVCQLFIPIIIIYF